MAKKNRNKPGIAPDTPFHVTDPDPLNEAIERLKTASRGLVCLESLLDEAPSLGCIEGQMLASLMDPHVSELTAVLDELYALQQYEQQGRQP